MVGIWILLQRGDKCGVRTSGPKISRVWCESILRAPLREIFIAKMKRESSNRMCSVNGPEGTALTQVRKQLMKNNSFGVSSRGARYVAQVVLTACALTQSVVAQTDNVVELDTYLISATRTPTDPESVTSVVTVLEVESMELAQIDDLQSALAQVPGLSVMQTGARGGPTSVFIRGGNADHTLFMVDGVRMNTLDASYTNFLGAASTAGLDRVEVLSGPQSTLYGSSALGGVIVVETARGRDEQSGVASVTAGAFDSVGGELATQGKTDQLSYSASVNRSETKNDRDFNEFEQLSYSTRIESTVTPNLLLGVTLRGDDLFSQAPGSLTSTYVGSVDTRQHLATAYAQWQLSDEVSSRLTYGWVQREYTYTPEPPPVGNQYDTDFYSRDTRNVLDWQTHWSPSEEVSIMGGLNAETENVTTITPSRTDLFSNDSKAAYLLAHYRPQKGTTLMAGLRHDDFDQFGTATTWKAGVSHLVAATGTKYRANYGTGFAAPRPVYVVGGPFYSPNPTIKPEESRGWDVGFDQALPGDRATASVTYFENRFRNLFTYEFSIPGIINTGLASSRGVETSVRFAPVNGISGNVSYTYLDADNDSKGVPLTRRPRHRISTQINWQVTESWLIGSGASYAGKRFDGSSSNPTEMPDYMVVRFFTHYDFGNGVRAKLRVENAFDKDYEAVRGYPSLPMAIHGGIEWRF